MSAAKGHAGPCFEDFAPGQILDCPVARRITDGDLAAYLTFTGDRTAPYCGAAPRVHPLIVFHIALGQTVRQVSLNARANLGYAELRWLREVRVGDVLRSRVEILGLKENSDGRHGIVWLRTTTRDQDDRTALSYVRWVMLPKRGQDRTSWREAPLIPTLAPALRAEDLAPCEIDPETADPPQGPWFLEDYAPGERIEHGEAQLVTDAEHMGFTRLFQNSARVHFQGRPLVYGGYVISLGYAQAHSGLENRLGLWAINAGSHIAPVYAGDTLSSSTEILEVSPLPGRPWGALRCRLQVVAAGAETRPVLELDYWERLPRRYPDHESDRARGSCASEALPREGAQPPISAARTSGPTAGV